MTTARFFVVALLLAAGAAAQTSNAPGNSPSSSSPAAGQSASQQTAPPANLTNPKGKHPPTAKTKPEYDAYLAAVSTADPSATGGSHRACCFSLPK